MSSPQPTAPSPRRPDRRSGSSSTSWSCTNAPGVLFELYNLSGDADLVLQQAVPPTMSPYFAMQFLRRDHAGADRAADRPNQPASVFVPDLRGHWYLGVYNNETNNVCLHHSGHSARQRSSALERPAAARWR